MINRNTAFASVLAALAFLSGIVQQFALRTHNLLLQSGLPYGLIALTVIFAWYKRDANERGYRRSMGLNSMVAACALIALPYYLFRSRGISRGLAATFKFFAMMLGYAVVQGAGHLLVHFLRRSS